MGSAHAEYQCTTCRREIPLGSDIEWCDECGRGRRADCSDYETYCLDSPKPIDADDRRSARRAFRRVGGLYDENVDIAFCDEFSWVRSHPNFVVPSGYDPAVVHRREAERIAAALLNPRSEPAPSTSDARDPDDDPFVLEDDGDDIEPTATQIDAVVAAGRHWNYYFVFRKLRPDAVLPFPLPEPPADRSDPMTE